MAHELGTGSHWHPPRPLNRRGTVVAAHPLAAVAGQQMLGQGGNAVDAFIAAAAAESVVQPCTSGLAGCGVLMLSLSGRTPRVLDFLGRKPAGATPEKLPAGAPDAGVLSVAVPGNLAGWARVLKDHGTASLAEALKPAIELAEGGVPMADFDCQMFEEHHARLDAEGVRTYLRDGRLPTPGARLVQPALAASLRRIAREGIGAFYEGAIAQAIVRDMNELGGLITRKDLAAYPGALGWTEPLVTRYRGVEVYAPPPPSTAIQLLATLNGMAGWELGALEHLGPEHVAVMAEAFQAARPRLAGGGRCTASTSNLAACDANGLAVSVTESLGGGFGSGVVVRGTGIALNSALHWTRITPMANGAQPGKCCECSLALLHLFRDGQFWATLGPRGGHGILVSMAQVVSNLIDFGLNIREAIDAPRFRWAGEASDPLEGRTIAIELRVPETTRRVLVERGYVLDVQGPWAMSMGGVQAVVRDPATGSIAGETDPHRDGYAMEG